MPQRSEFGCSARADYAHRGTGEARPTFVQVDHQLRPLGPRYQARDAKEASLKAASKIPHPGIEAPINLWEPNMGRVYRYVGRKHAIDPELNPHTARFNKQFVPETQSVGFVSLTPRKPRAAASTQKTEWRGEARRRTSSGPAAITGSAFAPSYTHRPGHQAQW